MTATPDQASPHTHTYAAPGTYTVTLNVTDSDGGLTNETSHSVTIANVAPIAAFTITTHPPQALQPVSFDASTSTDPDGGSITNYAWTFGDGGPPDQASPPRIRIRHPAPTPSPSTSPTPTAASPTRPPTQVTDRQRPTRSPPSPSPPPHHSRDNPSPSTPPPQPTPTAAQ